MDTRRRVRPVDVSALLGKVSGSKVYVDPRTGRVSDKPIERGISVPKTTWFFHHDPPILLSPEARERIGHEYMEMERLFPGLFGLYEDESTGELLWLGRIEGIGEIEVRYPLTFPGQKHVVRALDHEESVNDDLQRYVWDLGDLTAAGVVIAAMRFFLARLANLCRGSGARLPAPSDPADQEGDLGGGLAVVDEGQE